jgi:hypothetical protein
LVCASDPGHINYTQALFVSIINAARHISINGGADKCAIIHFTHSSNTKAKAITASHMPTHTIARTAIAAVVYYGVFVAIPIYGRRYYFFVCRSRP